MNRTLYFLIGGLCLVLTVTVAAEFDWSVTEVEASPTDSERGVRPMIAEPESIADIDQMTDEVLARPLFAPGRHPPAPPPEETKDAEAPPPKTPPVLTGRLTGMVLGPDQLKVAFFTRESEPSLSVKEGDVIDGWTVAAIEADRVVLTSEFGQRVVQPTFGQVARAQTPKPAKRPSITLPHPLQSAAPAPFRPGGQGGPVAGRVAPGLQNRAPVPAAVRQSRGN
jgi:hypothetical protein